MQEPRTDLGRACSRWCGALHPTASSRRLFTKLILPVTEGRAEMAGAIVCVDGAPARRLIRRDLPSDGVLVPARAFATGPTHSGGGDTTAREEQP